MELLSNASKGLYVITGAPDCGKSTLGAELLTRGYVVLPEVARKLIAYNQVHGGPLPWVKEQFEPFQRSVLAKQVERESKLRSLDEIMFADRGVSDSIAYYLANGIMDIPQDILTAAHNHRYAGVFILEPLGDCRKDGVRMEDTALARRIHQQMYMAYLTTGHDPIFVPVLENPAKRADFILDYINMPRRRAA